MGPCGLKCLLHQTLTLLLGVTGSRHASVGEVAAAAQLAGLCLHRAGHGVCSVGVPLHRCELNATEHFQFCAVISFARRALDFLIQDRADGGGGRPNALHALGLSPRTSWGGRGPQRSYPESPVTRLGSGPVTVPVSEGRCWGGVQEKGHAGRGV